MACSIKSMCPMQSPRIINEGVSGREIELLHEAADILLATRLLHDVERGAFARAHGEINGDLRRQFALLTR